MWYSQLVSHGSLHVVQLFGFVQESVQGLTAQLQQLPPTLIGRSCWCLHHRLPFHFLGTTSNLQLLQDSGHIGKEVWGCPQRQIVSLIASMQESLPREQKSQLVVLLILFYCKISDHHRLHGR